MSARQAARAAAMLLVAVSSGGCGGGGDRRGATADTAVLASAAGRDTTRRDSAGPRPATTPTDSVLSPGVRPAPALVTRADSAAGDALFHGLGGCQACHGNRGEGIAGLGPTLADTTWLHGDGTPAFIQGVILAGIARPKATLRGMPAFASRLSTAEASRIAAYVHSLGRPASVVDSLPAGASASTDTTTPP